MSNKLFKLGCLSPKKPVYLEKLGVTIVPIAIELPVLGSVEYFCSGISLKLLLYFLSF